MLQGKKEVRFLDSIQTILAPTDFSVSSTNAAFYVEGLFHGSPHKLILVNTYENLDNKATFLVSLQDVLSRESKKGLQKQSDTLLAELVGNKLDIITFSEEGNIKMVMENIVKKEHVELLSIGIHDHSTHIGPLHLKIPIVLKQECPALLVPENVAFKNPKNIALITDESSFTQESIKGIAVLSSIVKKHNSIVDIIQTNGDKRTGALSDKLQKIVLSGKFDMVAIITSAGDTIDKIIQQHMLDEVYSNLPTLLIRHK